MSVYSWTVSTAALSTTNDTMSLIPASSRIDWIIEVSVGGMGTSSVANEVDVFNQTTAGTTGSGAVTAQKFSPDSNAVGSVVDSAWTTQPVVGQPFIALPVNSNGGIYRWVARPGEEIVLRGAATSNFAASYRAKVTTSGTATIHTVVIEDPY
jgi:hypothetical protein